MKQKLFEKVIIIGTGLIGASMGLNLVRLRLASEVIGVGRGEANLRTAKRCRAIHTAWKIRATRDLFRGQYAEGLTAADLIVLATPVRTIHDFLSQIPRALINKLKPGTVITDVGSTKRAIVSLGSRRFKGPAYFVGAHPIAGTENSGASAAERDLFQSRTVILTPQGTKGVAPLKHLWKALGARVIVMTPARHDDLLARVSHLPHMVAYSLVNAVADPKGLAQLAAGGFRDITRIASSDPQMWSDICLENRKEILRSMQRFEGEWKKIKRALQSNDAVYLKRYFKQAKQRRDRLL